MSDASKVSQILVIDGMSDRFESPNAFAADLVAHLNGMWRRAGVPGAILHDASWTEGVLALDTLPGATPLTVEDIGRFLRNKKGKPA